MNAAIPTLALGSDGITIIIGVVCIILAMWLIELCLMFLR